MLPREPWHIDFAGADVRNDCGTLRQLRNRTADPTRVAYPLPPERSSVLSIAELIAERLPQRAGRRLFGFPDHFALRPGRHLISTRVAGHQFLFWGRRGSCHPARQRTRTRPRRHRRGDGSAVGQANRESRKPSGGGHGCIFCGTWVGAQLSTGNVTRLAK